MTHKAEPICYSVRILEVREQASPVKLSVSFTYARWSE